MTLRLKESRKGRATPGRKAPMTYRAAGASVHNNGSRLNKAYGIGKRK